MWRFSQSVFFTQKFYCIHLTYHLVPFMCYILSVGPLLVPRILNHKSKVKYPPDTSFSAFYVLHSVCWPPVGPHDFKTYK